MIAFDNVTKIYQENWIGLSEISTRIEKGEFVFVHGPSGAGKSTFLKLIYIEESPNLGRVFVFDNDLSQIKPKDIPKLRRRIGVIFQDFKLLKDRTVEENIAFALEVIGTPAREVKKQVLKALTWIKLSHKKGSYPYQLSGGEQQKIAIARALVRDPFILLADEPTGNLDDQSAEEIMDLLYQINLQGTTVVMATHDFNLIKRSKKRYIKLLQGRLVEDVP